MSLGMTVSMFRRGVGAAIGLAVVTGLGGGAGCDSNPADPEPPGPVVVTAPTADEAVRSPVTVTGAGVAGGTVSVTIFEGTSEIGTGSGPVDVQGTFDVDIAFTDQAVGTPMQIEVVQITPGGTSTPVVINVVQGGLGRTYATAAEAPLYQGTEYDDMQIYDVANGTTTRRPLRSPLPAARPERWP